MSRSQDPENPSPYLKRIRLLMKRRRGLFRPRPTSGSTEIAPGRGEFRLFTEGDELYGAMLQAIAEAKESVRLESYIFADDEIGRRFADAMAQAASAGVRVQLLIDAAGSFFWSSRRLERFLRHNGVHVRWYHRWSWRRPLRYNQRNHRKLLVVDSRQAFLGGFNIHRENSRELVGEQRWRDTHVQVGGPLAVEAARQFDAVWALRHTTVDDRTERAPAVLVSNLFRNGRRRIRSLYWERIGAARTKIYLATPYFVPDWRTLRRLTSASRRGVDVRVLLPQKSDVLIVQWAAHAVYAGLLEAGVRIYEYRPRRLHAKTAVIDREWSIIGSSNLDHRSFGINYELNLVARDEVLNAQMSEQFLKDLEDSEEVNLQRWVERPWMHRAFEWFGHRLQRWL